MFSEGWGLYAEQLAEETGLYAAPWLLGAVAASLMRAVRLVVDTGLHAFGWSREQARISYWTHVPMPPEFLAAEIDRYIVMPGQALAYLTGKREILRLRDEASRRLGPAFSLPAFHAAVLDQGSLPMPTLFRSIDAWLTPSPPRKAPPPSHQPHHQHHQHHQRHAGPLTNNIAPVTPRGPTLAARSGDHEGFVALSRH